MLSLLFALALACGLFLVYDALTAPRAPRSAEPSGAGRRLKTFLAEAGLPGRPWEFVVGSLGLGLVAAWLAFLAVRWPVLGLAAGVALGLVPTLIAAGLIDRRRAALRVALPDALAQLRDVLRGGLSVQAGLEVLAREGPDAVRPEFDRLLREARLGGPSGFADAVLAARDRLADPLWDLAAATLLLDDRQGGGLGEAFDELARSARAKVRALEELDSYRTHVEWSARVLAGLPLVLLVVGRLVSPDYFAVYDGPDGQAWLALALAVIGAGYLAMRWLARPPAEPRVLVETDHD
jgi:tight adherence protein B